MALLWEIANNPKEQTPSRIQAANHLLNRIQGMPVQTMVAATTSDLSSDELASQVDAYRRAILETGPSGRSAGTSATLAVEPKLVE
jgi:hypothetical protein